MTASKRILIFVALLPALLLSTYGQSRKILTTAGEEHLNPAHPIINTTLADRSAETTRARLPEAERVELLPYRFS